MNFNSVKSTADGVTEKTRDYCASFPWTQISGSPSERILATPQEGKITQNVFDNGYQTTADHTHN